ncbi:hypothetical protein CapIbe_008337 [Capra ibex]
MGFCGGSDGMWLSAMRETKLEVTDSPSPDCIYRQPIWELSLYSFNKARHRNELVAQSVTFSVSRMTAEGRKIHGEGSFNERMFLTRKK